MKIPIKRNIRVAFLLGLIASISSPTIAHHSNAPHFNNEVEISKTGIISEWKFVNPHAYLYFSVENNGGTIANWRCETEAASALKRRGYSNNTFKVGDIITVIGNPARREDNSCFTRDFVLADGTLIDRNTVLSEEEGEIISVTSERPAYLPNGEPNISGYWWDGDEPDFNQGAQQGMAMNGMGMGSPERLARLADIELTDAGQAQLDKYEFIYDDPSLHCKIANIMDALGRDESVNEIRQNGNTIAIQYGYMDVVRTIYMNKKSHPENLELTSVGHSIGHWDNEILVVESFGFLPSVLHPRTGIPTSDQLTIIEKFSYDSQAKELHREYIANDPLYLKESYIGQDTYRVSAKPYEPYNCEPLSGLNNLRPGSPEYEAELNKIGDD